MIPIPYHTYGKYCQPFIPNHHACLWLQHFQHRDSDSDSKRIGVGIDTVLFVIFDPLHLLFWWRYNASEGKRIEVTTRGTQEVGSRAKTKLEASWSLVKCFVCLFVFSYHLETEHSKPHSKHKELLQKCGCGLREWTWPYALKINSVSHHLAEGLLWHLGRSCIWGLQDVHSFSVAPTCHGVRLRSWAPYMGG